MGATVETCAAGEQAVAVCHLDNIFLISANGYKGSGAAFLPQVHIVLGVEGHNTLACGAGGGLDTNTLRHRLACQAIGICLPQVVLGQEGQLMQVSGTLNICRSQALFFHFFAVVGYIIPNMLHLLDQTLVLPSLDLLTGSSFDFRLIILCHW